MTAFDGSKKIDWLFADINGLVFTWGAMTALGLLFIVIVDGLTGTSLLAAFTSRWGSDRAFGAFIALTLSPSFFLVFVLPLDILDQHLLLFWLAVGPILTLMFLIVLAVSPVY